MPTGQQHRPLHSPHFLTSLGAASSHPAARSGHVLMVTVRRRAPSLCGDSGPPTELLHSDSLSMWLRELTRASPQPRAPSLPPLQAHWTLRSGLTSKENTPHSIGPPARTPQGSNVFLPTVRMGQNMAPWHAPQPAALQGERPRQPGSHHIQPPALGVHGAGSVNIGWVRTTHGIFVLIAVFV